MLTQVRKYAAEQLYVRLLTLEETDDDDDEEEEGGVAQVRPVSVSHDAHERARMSTAAALRCLAALLRARSRSPASLCHAHARCSCRGELSAADGPRPPWARRRRWRC